MTLRVPARNSGWWFLGSASGALTALAAHADLLHRAFPSMTPARQAQIEMAAFTLAWLSAHAAWSPLPMKPRKSVINPLPDIEPLRGDLGRFYKASTEH